jgi:hypothetical protein
MLPRSQKNKQIILKNEEDSDEEVCIGLQEKILNYLPKSQNQVLFQPKKMKYIQPRQQEPDDVHESYKKKISNI